VRSGLADVVVRVIAAGRVQLEALAPIVEDEAVQQCQRILAPRIDAGDGEEAARRPYFAGLDQAVEVVHLFERDILAGPRRREPERCASTIATPLRRARQEEGNRR
jgi:hypothetical protein